MAERSSISSSICLPTTTGSTNSFAPGSFILTPRFCSTTISPLRSQRVSRTQLSPQTYLKSEALSDFTFVGGPGANGIDPTHQAALHGVVESRHSAPAWARAERWRFGTSETGLCASGCIEDINEVNIFQSGPYGVLTNVKAAQANLAANNASGNANYAGSFANHGLAGQQATPLFDAAFRG